MEKSEITSAIVSLGGMLRDRGYCFTTVTPLTHRRVLRRARKDEPSKDPRDALRHFFGWNRVMARDTLPAEALDIMESRGLLRTHGLEVQSRLRFSTLDDHIYAHSSFPTEEESAIFFGPDSYRFVNYLRRLNLKPRRVVDIGCGSGVGAISGFSPNVSKIFTDINQDALIYAQANAVLNFNSQVEFFHADILREVPKGADLLIANPPFIMDSKNRKYRNGGGEYGAELALRIVGESLSYLQPQGCLALYTGVCVIEGVDIFRKRITELVPKSGFSYSYEEIDPDIFGEELSSSPYQDVERISAVGLTLQCN